MSGSRERWRCGRCSRRRGALCSAVWAAAAVLLLWPEGAGAGGTATATFTVTMPTVTSTTTVTLPTITSTVTATITVPSMSTTVTATVTLPTRTQTLSGTTTIPSRTVTQTLTMSMPTATRTLTATVSVPTTTVTITATYTMPTRTPSMTKTSTMPTVSATETQTQSLPTASMTSTPTLTLPTADATETQSITLPTATSTAESTMTLPTMTRTVSVSVTLPTMTQTQTVTTSLPTVTVTPPITATNTGTDTYTPTASETMPTPTATRDTITLPTQTLTRSSSFTMPTRTKSVSKSASLPSATATITPTTTPKTGLTVVPDFETTVDTERTKTAYSDSTGALLSSPQSVIVLDIFSSVLLPKRADSDIACVAYTSVGGTAPADINDYAAVSAMTGAVAKASININTNVNENSVANLQLSTDTSGQVLAPLTDYTVCCVEDPAGQFAGSGCTQVRTPGNPSLGITPTAVTSRDFAATVQTTGISVDASICCVAIPTTDTSPPGDSYAQICAANGAQNTTAGTGAIALAATPATGSATGRIGLITTDSTGAAIKASTDYTLKCRDSFNDADATSVVVSTLNDCRYDAVAVIRKNSRFVGNAIDLAGIAVSSGTLSTCSAGGDILRDGGTCTFSQPGYTSVTATCVAGKWEHDYVMNAVVCGSTQIANTVAHSTPGAISGTTEDVVTVTCAGGYSCDQTPCSVTCSAGTNVGDTGTFKSTQLGGTTLPVCRQDCPLVTVAGAAPAQCTPVSPADAVQHGTQCVWSSLPGFTCSNADIALTCNDGSFPARPVCTENQCTAFTFANGITGATCTDGVVLMAAGVASPKSCSLRCDTAGGYQAGSGTLTCPDAGGAPTSSLTCNPLLCPDTFNYADAGIVAPTDITVCQSAAGNTPCVTTCSTDGYTQNMAGPPQMQCTVTAAGVRADWNIINPCIGPATCGQYSCPTGYQLADNPSNLLCPSVDPVTAVRPTDAICTASSVTNNARCCPVAVACPEFASPVGTCTCDTGYSGTAAWDGSRWTHTCVEMRCDPITMQTGWESAGIGGCTPQTQLGAATGTTCSVQCARGYRPGSATFTCSAVGGTATLALSPFGFTCIEKSCAAYVLPPGVQGIGGSAACTNGIVLRPVTEPTTCSVRCADGFSGTATSVSCLPALQDQSVPAGNISCTENLCAPFAFPVGVEGAAQGGAAACTDGIQLAAATASRRTCGLQCMTSYTGTPSLLSCAPDARAGDVPTHNTLCIKNCLDHVCADGFVKRASPEGLTCPSGQCNDITCCTAAACPANAGAPGVCTCLEGWAVRGGGGPVWSSVTSSWTHVCEPVCSNIGFAGCTAAGFRLHPNATTTFCDTGVGCTVSSCTACTASRCCVENQCTGAGSLTQYNVAGGPNCTTLSLCGAVTCAPGFSGTPQLNCFEHGGPFTATGCAPAPCPDFASGAGVCNCNPGYAVTGGGGPVWSTTLQRWTHTCSTVCSNTLFTGCSAAGLAVKITPGSEVFCTGLAANPNSNPQTECTVAVCCNAVCTNTGFTGCDPTGYVPKADAGLIQCTDSTPASCAVPNCCDATCANTQFTLCQAAGYQLKALPDSIRCNNSDPATCGRDTCCDVIHCDQYTCGSGNIRKDGTQGALGDCAGVCTFDQCCRPNQCNPPTSTAFTGYVISGQTSTCNTVALCGGVTCTSGYSLTDPVAGASLTCPVDGQDFVPVGCTENACTLPASTAGYVIAGGLSCGSVTTCGDVTCAAGYEPTPTPQPAGVRCLRWTVTPRGQLQSGVDTQWCVDNCYVPGTLTLNAACQAGPSQLCECYSGPRVTCAADGGVFTLAGCREWVCAAPAPPWEYVFVGPADCATVTACEGVTCAPGYSALGARPSLQCPADGGTFAATGCSLNVCVAPSLSPVPGYVVATPSCTTAPACGEVTCDTGYIGAAAAVICEVIGGPFAGTGCTAAACPANSGPEGVCTCADGYTGAPSWVAPVWTHVCTPAACPQFATVEGQCNCLDGYVGTPQWDAVGAVWTHQCDAVPCPALATGAGVCTCDSGFAASTGTPLWDATLGRWAHVCIPHTCIPPGSTGLPGYIVQFGATCTTPAECGSIQCAAGFTAVAGATPAVDCVGTGAAFVPSGCTGVVCPPNSGPAGTCRCNDGFTGTPLFDTVSGTWTHTCTAQVCPLSASGAGVCTCNQGFSGTPRWDSFTGQWLHSCTLVTCPLNAQGAGCQCSNGFQGTPAWDAVAQRWTHTCTLQTTCSGACPANAGPAGVCDTCNDGFTGSPSCQCTQGVCQFTGTCAAVDCPANAAGAGLCTCNTGFTGVPAWDATALAWTHVCTIAVCPTGASGAPNCVCAAGSTGVLQWVSPGVWQGTCSASNLPPTATVAKPVVTAGPSPLAVTEAAVLTGVADPEGLAVTSQCTAANPALFTVQPQLVIAGGAAAVAFTQQPTTAVARPAESAVTCVLSDPTGLTTTRGFTVQLVDGTAGNVPPCGGVCLLDGGTVTASGTLNVPGYVTNYNAGGEPGQTVTSVCTPFDTRLVSSVTVTGSGDLTVITAAGRSGTTQVNCIATDSAGGVTQYGFRVLVPASSPADGALRKWLRVILRGLRRQFQRSLFEQVVRDSLAPSTPGLRSIIVWFVCPAIACPAGQCPASNAGRRAGGCLDGFEFAARRSAAALQLTPTSSPTQFPTQSPQTSSPTVYNPAWDQEQDLYIDFDVVMDVNGEPAVNTCERARPECDRAAQDIQTDLGRCLEGSACSFTPLQATPPAGQPVLIVSPTLDYPELDARTSPPVPVTPIPATASPDDDSSLSGPVIAAIVVGSVLYCVLLLLLLFLAMRRRGKKEKKVERFDSPKHRQEQQSRQLPDAGTPDTDRALIPPTTAPSAPPPAPSQQAASAAAGASMATGTAASTARSYEYSGYSYDSGSGEGSRSGSPSSPAAQRTFEESERVRAQYIDGSWYDCTVTARDPDGTYRVNWYDGTVSHGVPADQITPQTS